jgi:hypothetical protein
MPPSDPQLPTSEAEALLRAAERDLKTVELLLQHSDAPLSSVCFHAQQFDLINAAEVWAILNASRRWLKEQITTEARR